MRSITGSASESGASRDAIGGAQAPRGRLRLVGVARVHAGQRRVRADLGPDRRELGQADRRVDRVGGARPAAAKLDDRKPDRAHIDADDEAAWTSASPRRGPARAAAAHARGA